MTGTHTYAEIKSQPSVWQDALAVFGSQAGLVDSLWHNGEFDEVIFAGCGSTHYLSMTAANLFQTLVGVPARAIPASELVLYPNSVLLPDRKVLLVTVSRSGTTSETVAAARLFREKAEGKILGIGCYSESELMQMADLALVADSAREESVAQTRSFSSMLVLAQLLAGHLGGQDAAELLSELPQVCQRLMDINEATAKRIGEDRNLTRFFFLGSNALYGIACEAMLKLKEMSLSSSEAFHALEFRHGPMSMANEQTLMVGLLPETTAYPHEIAVLREMRGRNAQVLAVANQHESGIDDWATAVNLNADVPIWGRSALYLPVLQLMAYYRALANGQNPDQPANLTAVVSLDNLG